MQILNYLLTFLILGYIFTACQKSETRQEHIGEIALTKQNDIVIPLDSTTSSMGKIYHFTYDKDNNLLVLFNKPQQTLHFYSLSTFNEIHRLKYPKQGPNSVPSMIDVQMVSKDSIFILSSYVNRMYLSDWSGKIYNSYSLLDQTWDSEISFGFVTNKEKAYFQSLPMANPSQPETFYRSRAGASYDLNSNKSTAGLFEYPSIYKQDGPWGLYHNIFFQTMNNAGDVIVSFPLDPKLLVIRNGKKEYKINAPSQYFTKKTERIKTTENPIHYFITQNAYDKIIYDKYRDVYYRIATIAKDEIPSDFSEMSNPGLFKSISVMILNDSLKVIGETLLPKNTYDHQSLFVAQDGLYIAKTHPSNPELSEDKMAFTRFSLTKP